MKIALSVAAWLLAAMAAWGQEATALGRQAAAMKPGEWKVITTAGYDKELMRAAKHWIFEYTHDGQWDDISGQFLFVGQGHYSPLKFIHYSEAAHAWKVLPTPWYEKAVKERAKTGKGPVIGHAYDNNAIDVANRIYFHRQYGETLIHRFDIARGRWIDPLDFGKELKAPSRPGHSSGLEYFPEMGGLVMVRVPGVVDLWDSKTEKWKRLASADMGLKMHPLVEYNPVHGAIIFGGGNKSNSHWMLDRKGKITPCARPPLSTWNSTHSYVLTVDPAGGEFLLIDNSAALRKKGNPPLYGFDLKKNEWRKIAESIPAKGFLVAAPIAKYGVIMVCSYRPEKVWLYKHTKPKNK